MRKPDQKILLVDDEPRLLSALRRLLSDRFHILTAERGADAIALLEQHNDIGAMVVDMRMPEMTGLELLSIAVQRWPDVRRLMLTGNTDLETAVNAANEGKVFRFLLKPCDADELAVALRDAIEEYRFATQDKQLREMLEIKAEAGERARNTFLSLMSHEMLTPLNHVLGFTAVLQQQCRERGEIESLAHLDNIRNAGENLLRIVRRVLEISRLNSGEGKRPPAKIDVAELIREELDKVRPKAESRDIVVSFQTLREPVLVFGNSHDIRFALSEVLDNAMKFNHNGGHISVAVNATDETVTIRVADTGIGMREEELERAIRPFQQLEAGNDRRFEGIGLGLTLASMLITSYGGKLSLESGRRDGAALLITLKRAVEAGMAAKIA